MYSRTAGTGLDLAVGIQVTSAGDGRRALKILANRRFDALLTGPQMPEV